MQTCRCTFFYFNKFLKHTTYLCICSYAVAVHCYNNDIPAVVLACWKIYAQSACVISQSFINMQTAHRSTYQQAPGRVAQSVGHLTRKSGVPGSIPGLATYFRFSFRFFKKGSCQLLAKDVHEVLVNRLGGLSLPRKSVVRLTDRPDMTLDVYRGRKTTIQIQPTSRHTSAVCSSHLKIFYWLCRLNRIA